MNSNDKQEQQEQLYVLLERLKTMARDIPQKYQQRLPYDLLSSLAHLLLDDTVFEIVRELVDLQLMTEKHLHQQRNNIITRHKCEKDTLLKSHKQETQNAQCQGRLHVLSRLPSLHEEQLKQMEVRQAEEQLKFDKRILEILDEKVAEQQSILEQVGVPSFKVTNNVMEVKVQMYIIGFILKLANIKTNS